MSECRVKALGDIDRPPRPDFVLALAHLSPLDPDDHCTLNGVARQMAYLPESSSFANPDTGLAAITSRGETLEDTQVIITDEIETARSRNASVPIASLLPELLTQIFAIIKFANPPSRNPDQTVDLGWIPSATHVCHYWREVALAHSMLWTDIIFALGPRWAEELLVRSKTAPLSLVWKPEGIEPRIPSSPVVEGLIATGLIRTRELEVWLPGAPILDSLFQSLLLISAPMLDIVWLRAEEGLESTRWSTVHSSIPHGFFEGKGSRLRTLTLIDISSGWASLPTSALEYLSINFSTAEPHAIPMPTQALDQFIDFLENTPTLERLVLRQGLPYNAFLGSQAGRVVNLPRLRQVELMGPRLAIANLLSHINTDVLLELRLSLRRNGHRQNTFPDYGFFIPPHLYPALDIVIVRDGPNDDGLLENFVLAHPAPNLTRFELSSDRQQLHGPIPQFVSSRAPKLHNLTLRGFGFSLEHLPVANLTRLHLALPDPSWSSVTLDGLLDRLQATSTLQVLILVHCLPSHVIGSAPSHAAERVIPLPNLRRFILYGKSRDVAAFAHHVDLPAGAQLDINCNVPDGHNTESEWDPPSAFVFKPVAPARSFTCKLQMSPGLQTNGHLLVVRGYRRFDTVGAIPLVERLELNHDPDIRIALRTPIAQRPTIQDVIKIWSPAIVFQALDIMCIPKYEGRWDLPQSAWRDIFRQLRSVQHLSLRTAR
ncbi:hypothetical protein BV25DRAFT_1922314 [Artomyces pyxidatus]|uniref:Uncharacterized protein n=1 Tax=Artomyces pyxidatus TaxID=48021 RepID=A0ACB8SEF9_9AGAM|nr:hypothetical protein BV25DRAFT_1922314 [Artomyces pyxidatus]